MSNCVAPEMEKLDLLDVAVIAVAEFVPQDVFRCARVSTAWRTRLLGTKQKRRRRARGAAPCPAPGVLWQLQVLSLTLRIAGAERHVALAATLGGLPHLQSLTLNLASSSIVYAGASALAAALGGMQQLQSLVFNP